MERAHLRGGRIHVGGSRYAYPLWWYGGYWYPWWYAYHVGLMDLVLYNEYAAKYGGQPATYSGPTDPTQLRVASNALMCSVCNSVDNLHLCSGCNEAVYCGTECQARDWPLHRDNC